jgi:hypothetical protein
MVWKAMVCAVSALVLDYWGCLVRCETDFVPFLVNFDQNNAKQRKRRTAKI